MKPNKAGIAIDSWKLKIFQKQLDKEGYTVKVEGELTKNVLTLTVEYFDIGRLTRVIQSCELLCAKEKRKNGLH